MSRDPIAQSKEKQITRREQEGASVVTLSISLPYGLDGDNCAWAFPNPGLTDIALLPVNRATAN